MDGARPKKILCIEDNLDLVVLYRLALDKPDRSLQFASTGAQGIQLARDWKPDAIFVDLTLPDMFGSEVSKRIHQECDPCPVILAVTGYRPDEFEEEMKEAGIQFCIQKPMNFHDLVQALNDALDKVFGEKATAQHSPI